MQLDSSSIISLCVTICWSTVDAWPNRTVCQLLNWRNIVQWSVIWKCHLKI